TNNSRGQPITVVEDDLMHFDKYINTKVELIVCMTDTLLHLDTKDKIVMLFNKVFEALEEKGKFILTFRDLSSELSGTDRFIPVKNDETTIFTCFLEYEPETVKVHDIVYKKENDRWRLYKSFYRKIRLSKDWIEEQLSRVGFNEVTLSVENGLITIIAVK
ncbi:MAG: class I SAM-dependent methyltransferase, partial [Bacillota bacterium]